MNRKLENIPAVLPPALDTEGEEFAARHELITKNANLADDFEAAEMTADGLEETVLGDTDETIIYDEEAQEEEEAQSLRRAKRRQSVVFLSVFAAGFGILVVILAWAFGFGFFAPPSRISVDRNQKSNSPASPNISSDEKLKTALALVADDAGNNRNSPLTSDAAPNPNAKTEQDLSLTSGNQGDKKNDLQSPGNMIVLPNENQSSQPKVIQPQTPTPQTVSSETVNPNPNSLRREMDERSQINQPKTTTKTENLPHKAEIPVARSVFFGRASVVQDNSISKSSKSYNQGGENISVSNLVISKESANIPPFGTLLPVRLLGAVYTLRGSGNLVRMELSRAASGNGFSYRAGTVLVGNLRGGDYNRAFISIIGAIDPKTNKLIKFSGEVLGTDGASGVSGERKSIKGWGTRFLSAVREMGAGAVNILSSRTGRGSGTVILSGSGGLGGEASSVIRGDSPNDSFVEVRAGTEGYVLITDLPAEKGSDGQPESPTQKQTKIKGLNLSETEMAELLTTSDADKIRAVLLKMSPEFRALALQAMEDGK